MSIELHHLHMVGKAFVNHPPLSAEEVNAWLETLVDVISMKILMGPYSIKCETLGNEGVTGAVVIETSHSTIHFWHAVDEPFGMFDVYSCAAFDPQDVLMHLHSAFDVVKCEYAVMDRNDNIRVVEEGTWRP